MVLRRRPAWGNHRAAEIVNQPPNLLTGEDLPPEPRQERSRERHARLKVAGLAIFGRKGYQAASIEEIAVRAKLPVGTFYQHFRSKRQLLLALMNDLLEKLSRLNLHALPQTGIRMGLRELLSRAFAQDLEYLGAYRAWQEAVLADRDLQRKQRKIRAWTTNRVLAVFRQLQRLPRARREVDLPALARIMDSFFWGLLGQALTMRQSELTQWIDSATHLIFHALFTDDPQERG